MNRPHKGSFPITFPLNSNGATLRSEMGSREELLAGVGPLARAVRARVLRARAGAGAALPVGAPRCCSGRPLHGAPRFTDRRHLRRERVPQVRQAVPGATRPDTNTGDFLRRVTHVRSPSVSKQSSLSPDAGGCGAGMGTPRTATPSHGSHSKRETTTPTTKPHCGSGGLPGDARGHFRQESWGGRSLRHPRLRTEKQAEPQSQPKLPGDWGWASDWGSSTIWYFEENSAVWGCLPH